ncbi:metal-dependent hydrolase [Brevibacterium luteolum]|uniref:metal-dependent hydrolase n=1 Tax=Brevibacterium luteolum TaxID=199591 RepID=UPI00223AE99A|nr:metal-dependent hydrolase [Brevibacterium luteolum]MCT1874130.1 metal-dependent hydrolase [Brevibacterium luteolum]MCT1891720.1 metal-dependent hydrolase [Brevibacterium luteolum]MCT1893182.1 metal-dependent hydrolase [Brevibacterium luteolum]MCT1924075.1 metal-dependent hydrolase [Brevibacterium luteolum]
MTDSTILYNADVYSSADPFATAIMFTGDTVAWVGSDEAACAFEGAHHDLAGAFVTPGLVAAAVDLRPEAARPAPSGDQLLARGVTAAHLIGTSEQLEEFASSAPEALVTTAYQLGGAGEGFGALPASALDADALPDGAQFVLIDSAADLTAVLGLLEDAGVRAHLQRNAWRLLINVAVPSEAIDALAQSGLGITVDPLGHRQPLAQLLAAGAQVSFALTAENPWQTLRAAVYDSADGVSARAAFNAVTRFGYRALGSFDGGVLAPGAAATACVWSVESLLVQAADSRVAAWSTDPRSGTPGLPDLSSDAALPQLLRVWANGTAVTS